MWPPWENAIVRGRTIFCVRECQPVSKEDREWSARTRIAQPIPQRRAAARRTKGAALAGREE